MEITIIGSLSRIDTMNEIENYLNSISFEEEIKVNNPANKDMQGLPLQMIQKMWIENIRRSDFIIAVPKILRLKPDSGETSYEVAFGESTSYELAIAEALEKPVLIHLSSGINLSEDIDKMIKNWCVNISKFTSIM